MRTVIYSILLFVLAGLLSVVLLAPVGFFIEQLKPYIPDQVSMRSPEGTIFKGSVLISSKLLDAPVPVTWKPCFIDLSHPIGWCFTLQVKGIPILAAVQPWVFNDIFSVFDIRVDTDMSRLAALHPALGIISVIEGKISTDIQRLRLDMHNMRLTDIAGTVHLTDASLLGLKLGNINTLLNAEPVNGDNNENDIIIAVEGGTIDQVEVQGTGVINPQGELNIRFLLRSNDRLVQQQLAAVMKSVSDTEFEFNYSTTLWQ